MKLLEFYLLLFSLIILNGYLLNAQWEETSGPPHVEITSSLASFITDSGDTNLYAGINAGGIFLSTNNGDSWKSIVENWDYHNGGFTKKNITALLPVKDDEGYHSIIFKASNLSSGVYFYRIEVKSEGGIGLFTKTRKLELLK